MVGGRLNSNEVERIYRFEFPERPGALLNFLNRMGQKWNISLFHYRNHGSAFGRVLCGFQIPQALFPTFNEFLKSQGYEYSEERDLWAAADPIENYEAQLKAEQVDGGAAGTQRAEEDGAAGRRRKRWDARAVQLVDGELEEAAQLALNAPRAHLAGPW